ncbi:MAG: oligosaccharide flippase family protein [Cyclobacteriaceae bacterium]|nr:oligosaccharide flippase family protein [Cyclobacteriaceae bacterium]
MTNNFNKNVLVLFTGTTLAQAIPIAVSPILTRLYTPEDFGVFAIFFSITNLLGVVATWRYELSIVLPSEEDEADLIEYLCFLIAFVFALMLFVLTLFLNERIASLLGRPDIASWLYLVPLSVFFTGIIQTINYRLNRGRNFREMSTIKIIQTSSSGVSGIVLGLARFSLNGLVISQLFGQLMAIGSRYFKKKIGIKHRASSVLHIARKYKNFAMGTPGALLNKAATSLPIFLMSKLADKNQVGYYGLVERSIGAPISLISYSVSQVLLEEIASRYRMGLPIRSKILRLSRNLFLVGIIPFGVLCIFASEIFKFVFGSEWVQAGSYASVLSIAFFARFIVSPLSSVFFSTNSLKKLVLWQVLYFFTTFSIIVYNYFNFEIDAFLILLVINDLTMYLFHFVLILSVTKD